MILCLPTLKLATLQQHVYYVRADSLQVCHPDQSVLASYLQDHHVHPTDLNQATVLPKMNTTWK